VPYHPTSSASSRGPCPGGCAHSRARRPTSSPESGLILDKFVDWLAGGPQKRARARKAKAEAQAALDEAAAIRAQTEQVQAALAAGTAPGASASWLPGVPNWATALGVGVVVYLLARGGRR
jgi:hypothetical protein